MVSEKDQLSELIVCETVPIFCTFGTVKRFSKQQTDSVFTFGKCLQRPRGFDQFLWWYLGPYLGSLAISEVGVCFIINRIGCILAAVMFVNHPLFSV